MPVTRRLLILRGIGLLVVLAPALFALPGVQPPLLAGQRVAAAPVMHDIVIQPDPVSGRSRLYNRLTGLPFVPVGNNYLRDDSLSGVGVTFDPGVYSPGITEAAFQKMQQYGYNTVRLFIWPSSVGNPNGPGLSGAYLTNVTDALKRAKAHALRPIISLNELPTTGGYFPTPWPPPGYDTDPDINIAKFNWYYLSQAAFVASQQYMTDFITGLQARNAPLASVLAYETTGEIAYWRQHYPLSQSSGMFATKTGMYDLGNTSARDLMMDTNIVAFIDGQVDAIKAADPYALTSVQLVPDATNPDPLAVIYPDKWPMLTPNVTDAQGRHGSKVDFISLSLYPTYDNSMAELMNSFGVAPGGVTKPLITLEMGYLSNYLGTHPALTFGDLAARLVQWEKDSCTFNVNGWFLFTWDNAEIELGYYNAVENNDLLARALAPRTIPDVCGILQPARSNISLPTAACASGLPVLSFALVQAENVTRYDVYRQLNGAANAVKIGTVHPADFVAGAYTYTDSDAQLQEDAYYTYTVAAFDENNPNVAATPTPSYHPAHDTDDLGNQPFGQASSGFKRASSCTLHPVATSRGGPPLPATPNPLPIVPRPASSSAGSPTSPTPNALPPPRP